MLDSPDPVTLRATFILLLIPALFSARTVNVYSWLKFRPVTLNIISVVLHCPPGHVVILLEGGGPTVMWYQVIFDPPLKLGELHCNRTDSYVLDGIVRLSGDRIGGAKITNIKCY